jgi:hypothetical protein
MNPEISRIAAKFRQLAVIRENSRNSLIEIGV